MQQKDYYYIDTNGNLSYSNSTWGEKMTREEALHEALERKQQIIEELRREKKN